MRVTVPPLAVFGQARARLGLALPAPTDAGDPGAKGLG